VVLAPQRLVGDGDFYHCTWKVVLNRFHSVGLTNSTDRFLDQEPQDTVDGVFNMLVDSPVDPKEVRGPGSNVLEQPEPVQHFLTLAFRPNLLTEIHGLPLLPEGQLHL
jgi:hypothetical protein